MSATKVVKIPPWAYDNARCLQRRLVAHGIPPALLALAGGEVPKRVSIGWILGLGTCALRARLLASHAARRPSFSS